MSISDLRALIDARMQERHVKSYRALAQSAGISKNTLTNWFSGRTVPSPYQLAEVGRVLETELRELWAAYADGDGGARTPSGETVARYEDALREAYERGFDRGFRAGLEAPRPHGPQ